LNEIKTVYVCVGGLGVMIGKREKKKAKWQPNLLAMFVANLVTPIW
jgi:hypothetical protein